MDPATLVPTFNALPRNHLSPSGAVPNHWHISLRHIPLQPPGYVLFIVNPASEYVHTEGPLAPGYQDASIEIKATLWSILLLRAFNGSLGTSVEQLRGSSGIGRPWSWVCNDAEMAGAVGERLRGLGVTAPEGIGIAEAEDNGKADEAWNRLLTTMRQSMGSG